MFFESGSFAARKLSMEHFREWAGTIAGQYLNEGTLPTEALCKTAQSEDLTPDNINVLAAEINKEIHRQKFASMKDKYFAADFPLADASVAIKKLQADGGAEKIASVMPEPIFKKPELDPFEAFGTPPEVQDKTASVRHELKHAGEKLASMERMLLDKQTVLSMQMETTAARFLKQASQFVHETAWSQTERLIALEKLHTFIKSAGMSFAAPLLEKVAHTLGHGGWLSTKQVEAAASELRKTADIKAPECLISDTLPAQIVNGNHPLYITLKTFRDQHNALNLTNQQLKLTEDRLHILKQKVRAL
jgi:hypothetical protein